MTDILIALALILCAVQAVSAKKLLASALWLAGCSAMVALLLYRLGAPEIAVIELSVGAGLITILFVFAINIAGDEQIASMPFVPPFVAWLLIALSFGALIYLNLPLLNSVFPALSGSVPSDATASIWNQRWLDTALQIALIFCGVLGVLSLIQDTVQKENEL